MKSDKLKGKVAIVTGSSMGIGFAIAQELLLQGANVVINGRNAERLQQACDSLGCSDRVLMIPADISAPEDCSRLVDLTIARFGRLDILINNAGLSMEGNLESISASVWQRLFNVNVLGAVYTSRAAIPHLKETKGSILFINSLAALVGLPLYSAYSSSKMALAGVADSLRIELAPFDIHVGSAFLGFTENDDRKQILNSNGNNVPQPSRKEFHQQPVQWVAQEIVRMVIKRRDREVFSTLGKALAFVNRFFPGFVVWRLSRMYRKRVSSNQAVLKSSTTSLRGLKKATCP